LKAILFFLLNMMSINTLISPKNEIIPNKTLKPNLLAIKAPIVALEAVAIPIPTSSSDHSKPIYFLST
jgi:hypothetical protein